MRMAEIAERLRQFLPSKTDLFSKTVTVQRIVSDGSSAQITTSRRHNLSDGDSVVVSDVGVFTPILSLVRDGLVVIVSTDEDHDLTERADILQSVRFDGFTDSGWNNVAFPLVRVFNRRTFSIRTSQVVPILNGNEVLIEPDRIDGFNGEYSVDVAGPRTLTITGSFPILDFTTPSGKVTTNPRVGVAADLERATKLFDEAPSKEFWSYVVPAPATVSKDRSTASDAVSAKAAGNTMRLRILDHFTVFVFCPTHEELAAEEAIDICRHDLMPIIIGGLFGYYPQTGLDCPNSEFRIIPTAHEVVAYNEAFLIYAFEFEAPMDLSSADIILREGTRAFRDVDYAQTNLHDPATAAIDLDEQPL